ncbi:hypothetical protein [Acinetobacter baumannii]|uniref:hypothetical protein n=1 Tax=Acinetobacter baumannii TaxID=470 RepID=UPI0012EE5D33|nr:hypothetical protein [Acinetobacter baumannii]MDC4768684.1 hypothetical protein [Acinetobacter baumannii]MVM70710.1 hypothetical protein [Acinetobacter baumannii]
MKPEQFIREYGPNTFRISMSFVNTAKYLVVHEGEIDFTDEIKPHHGDRVFERDVVKRLVESLDLINKLGGLQGAKAYVPDGYKSDRLKQAIRDHESIYGGGDDL